MSSPRPQPTVWVARVDCADQVGDTLCVAAPTFCTVCLLSWSAGSCPSNESSTASAKQVKQPSRTQTQAAAACRLQSATVSISASTPLCGGGSLPTSLRPTTALWQTSQIMHTATLKAS